MRSQSSVIIAENLSKSFGKTNALNGVDLAIEKSGVTAILGANGAGKTTFINTALGLISPNKGRVRIFGARAGSMTARQRTGVMLQGSDLPELLSAEEHIALIGSYYKDPLSVDEVIFQCGMESFAAKPYKKLSGGQKRRVQFALSITGRPDLIFLDEPTTGLDTDARRALWQIVRALAEDGKTIILTTHYLEEADVLADRIVVLNKGEIIADGPTEEIRDAVGGAIIRCITEAELSVLRTLPEVRSAREAGRYAEMMTSDQTETMKALLSVDPSVKDLTVTKPSLEEAFLDLTENSKEAVQ